MTESSCECGACDLALLAKGLSNWTGGTDYLRLCMAGLSTAAPGLRLCVALPQPTMRTQIRKSLGDARRGILQILRHGRFDVARVPFPTIEEVRNSLRIDDIACRIVTFPDSRGGLFKSLKLVGAQAVFPALESLGSEFPVPWVGYIPDFQHRYLPELFSQRECRARDGVFSRLVEDAKVLSLNSQAVAADVRRFYPRSKCKIVVLPFAPTPEAGWLELDGRETLRRYQLPQRYFLISNQFWIHKSHMTAFEALGILRGKPRFEDVELVCTGSRYDYRRPRYFEELGEQIEALGLSSKIRFLGKIPKNEQIAIMKQAVAVIQPTLFEGGPGGGSVYDAVAVGARVIASDIAVNREILHESVRFFHAKSPMALAGEMERSLDTPYQRPEAAVLHAQGQLARQRFGEKIIEAIALSRHRDAE